jgi:hypothetical protein
MINSPAVIDQPLGKIENKGYKAYVAPEQREKKFGREGSTGESKAGKPKFITFYKVNLREQERPKRGTGRKEAGWKFHLSINDLISGNVEKAWNVLWPVLCKYEIVATKVVPYNTFHGHQLKQVGKQITIYAFNTVFSNNPETNNEHWVAFLEEIDRVLTDANVVPGPAARLDHVLDQSRYISYCNDARENGFTYDRDHEFNRHRFPDPFADQRYQFKSADREAKVERQPTTIDEYQKQLAEYLKMNGLSSNENQQPSEKAEKKNPIVSPGADVFSAIASNDIDQAVKFIKEGTDLSMKDSDDRTVLTRAQDAWGHNSPEVRRLEEAATSRLSALLQAPSSMLQPSNETTVSSSSTISRSY